MVERLAGRLSLHSTAAYIRAELHFSGFLYTRALVATIALAPSRPSHPSLPPSLNSAAAQGSPNVYFNNKTLKRILKTSTFSQSPNFYQGTK